MASRGEVRYPVHFGLQSAGEAATGMHAGSMHRQDRGMESNRKSHKKMEKNMKKKSRLLVILAMAFILPVAMMMLIACPGQCTMLLHQAEGPCDIMPLQVSMRAAHSSTRALYASYNGPLYQVMRQSDGKT